MVKTLERDNRTTGQVDRRIRIQIDAPPASHRRVVSAWKEEARALLAACPLDSDEAATSVPEMEIASALRQPRLWDVRTESRNVNRGLAKEAAEAQVTSACPMSLWLRWEFVVSFAIGLAAILQIIAAIR